jgi:hypothetical protein
VTQRRVPLPEVIALPEDFFAGREGPAVATVVHEQGCTRAPCRCFGITSEVVVLDEAIVSLRLYMARPSTDVDPDGWRSDAELVGMCRLMVLGDLLVLVQGTSYRASTTTDWGLHHQVVTEMMLREAARVADERGQALATSIEQPRALLDELGFRPAGTLMRRERGGCG